MMRELPDGSGFTVASFPLPAGHWLYAPGVDEPPAPLRVGVGQSIALSFTRDELVAMVQRAARHAVRSATTRGKLDDFDPDALVQDVVVGLLGYFTPDGLSHL